MAAKISPIWSVSYTHLDVYKRQVGTVSAGMVVARGRSLVGVGAGVSFMGMVVPLVGVDIWGITNVSLRKLSISVSLIGVCAFSLGRVDTSAGSVSKRYVDTFSGAKCLA